MDQTPIKIVMQGGVHPSTLYGAIVRRGDGIAAIYVDLVQKRCKEFGSSAHEGAPCLLLGVSDDTPKPENLPGNWNDFTDIAFPEFIGFRVFSARVSRYTLAVCLVKENGHDQ